MQVLIRESLRQYMSQHKLAEYLAGVGAHEAEQSEYRADTILTRTLQVASDAPGKHAPPAVETPRFRSRTELTNKFKKHGSEFSTRARNWVLSSIGLASARGRFLTRQVKRR